MPLKTTAFFVTFLLSFLGNTQVETEVAPPDYIRTIIFKGQTDESQLPIIKLNEPLTLEFDALGSFEDDYYYEIEHYDYNWEPSRLVKTEFMQGFDHLRITEYRNSFNTYQNYSHYYLTIPNQQTRLKVSGNYMLKIFDENGELMFSRKFMIQENLANVGVLLRRSRDVKYLDQKQSVDIRVISPSIQFDNPERSVNALIIQNNNLHTAITGVKPQYTVGRELRYSYVNETSFWGGNEYLYFENKDVRGANVGIQFIELKELYHSYLYTDIIRANRPYTYNPDVNGNFVITALDIENPDIAADYTWVHFSLEHPELLNKRIYIYGNYNNYHIGAENEMVFNPDSGLYEGILLIKQGFYNYKYIIVDDFGKIDEGAISGNFDIAENNYKVLIYYRPLGGRYDRIVGFGEASSINITN